MADRKTPTKACPECGIIFNATRAYCNQKCRERAVHKMSRLRSDALKLGKQLGHQLEYDYWSDTSLRCRDCGRSFQLEPQAGHSGKSRAMPLSDAKAVVLLFD